MTLFTYINMYKNREKKFLLITFIFLININSKSMIFNTKTLDTSSI